MEYAVRALTEDSLTCRQPSRKRHYISNHASWSLECRFTSLIGHGKVRPHTHTKRWKPKIALQCRTLVLRWVYVAGAEYTGMSEFQQGSKCCSNWHSSCPSEIFVKVPPLCSVMPVFKVQCTKEGAQCFPLAYPKQWIHQLLHIHLLMQDTSQALHDAVAASEVHLWRDTENIVMYPWYTDMQVCGPYNFSDI